MDLFLEADLTAEQMPFPQRARFEAVEFQREFDLCDSFHFATEPAQDGGAQVACAVVGPVA